MFITDFEKFKSTVEDTIFDFFKVPPKQLDISMRSMEAFNSGLDFANVDIKEVDDEAKETLLRYRTMKYFNDVYKKLLELEETLKDGDDDDTGV